jgi:uncharacterized membrane protein YdjX (TVP38/TMEM64 family)
MVGSRPTVKAVLAGGTLGLLLLAAVAAQVRAPSLAQEAQHLLSATRELGWGSWLALAAAQAVIAASGILPASLLGVAAGAIYGVGPGFALVGIGTLAGALIAFLLSRSLFRPFVARLLHKRVRFQNLDRMIARHGWRFICLLRLSPVMPFAPTSYALGCSSVRFRDYSLGTIASLLPLLGYVLLGALAGRGLTVGDGATGIVDWGMLALGIAATAGLAGCLYRILRRAGIELDHGTSLEAEPAQGSVQAGNVSRSSSI